MSEEGAGVATELWLVSGKGARTPWQALHDPHFDFNVAVLRGYMKAKQVQRDLAAAAGADPLGAAIEEAAGED